MRVLITGVTGFAGLHLLEALADSDAEIFGISRRPQFVAPEPLRNRLAYFSCDLVDQSGVERLLRQIQPQQIYHLAGYASPGESLRHPRAAWRGNLEATLSLYEAVVAWGETPRLLYVSSGLIYGEPTETGEAFHEGAPLRPVNPYGASKAAADLASFQYTRFPGLPIIRARPFNHIGPRQSPQFAIAHFAQQIAAIEKGQHPPVLETGDLRPLRDVCDVRDVVSAYILLMESGRVGEAYNVASGTAIAIGDLLHELVSQAKVKVVVKQREELMRAKESKAVRGDNSKIRNELGWSPKRSLQQSLADVLEYWRQQY
ncbi:MAG: GDP-mannose 4,6-dehydratase [Gemmatales bacterium]|nr:MAG: GDP-mannose 4,6-dehydratase [Gemmatales bacterium]